MCLVQRKPLSRGDLAPIPRPQERRLTLIGVSLLLLAVVAVAAWVELAAPPLGTASLDGSGLGRWLAPLLRWLRLA